MYLYSTVPKFSEMASIYPNKGKESCSPAKTILYLAYGSNLTSKTFLGRRGMQSLSQTSVVVPKLRLTFNPHGPPYSAPWFASAELRTIADGGRPHQRSPSSSHRKTWTPCQMHPSLMSRTKSILQTLPKPSLPKEVAADTETSR